MYVSVYKEEGSSPLLQDASVLKHTHTHMLPMLALQQSLEVL